MSTIQEKALALHAAGSNCAQCVLCAFADTNGFDFCLAHSLCTCLGAGFGRRQLVCGAVTGGAMAIGATLGNECGADQKAKERCYELVNAFVATIEKEFGSSDCRSLLGVDISTDEGRSELKAKGLGTSVCDKIIARSAQLIESIILEQQALG